MRGDSNLGSLARFACNTHDLNDAFSNLRHLKVDQLAHQIWVRPADHNIEAAMRFVNFEHVELESFVWTIVFRADLLSLRQLDLSAVDLKQNVCILSSGDGSAEFIYYCWPGQGGTGAPAAPARPG